LEKFVKAVRRAVLAFETRVFLRDRYPRAHFERHIVRKFIREKKTQAENQEGVV